MLAGTNGHCVFRAAAARNWLISGLLSGRSERIRTSGPCVPNTVLYQAELHSDRAGHIASARPLGKVVCGGPVNPT